jgi:hypothetical protein
VYTTPQPLQEERKTKRDKLGSSRIKQVPDLQTAAFFGHRIELTSPNLFPWLHVSDGNMYATGVLPSWLDTMIFSSFAYFDIHLGALG